MMQRIEKLEGRVNSQVTKMEEWYDEEGDE